METCLTFGIKLYPTKEQKEQIRKNMDACDFVYNYFLGKLKLIADKDPGKFMPFREFRKELTQMRKDEKYYFLKDVDRVAMDNHLEFLKSDYDKFRTRGYAFPHPKDMNKLTRFYRTASHNENTQISPTIQINEDTKFIKLPRLGWVKYGADRIKYPNYKIRLVHIKATSDKLYSAEITIRISFLFEPIIFHPREVGIDPGVKTFLTLSNGFKIDNPKIMKSEFDKRQFLRDQWHYYRINKDTEGMIRSGIALVKEERHILNKRRNFHYNVANQLLRNFDILYIENFQTKKLIEDLHHNKLPYANHVFRSFYDIAMYSFFNLLVGKAIVMNKLIYFVPEEYRSSRHCHVCGFYNQYLDDKGVGESRMWLCPMCGTWHDRDINAAKNILINGRKMIWHNYIYNYQLNNGLEPDSFFVLNNAMPNYLKVTGNVTKY